MGVFKYSKEEGKTAVKLKEQIPEARKEERYDQIMYLQQEVSVENNQKIIGQKLECIIDGLTDDGEMYVTRSYRDVPDTDGFVFVNKEKEHKVGDFIECIVKEAYEYDLTAKELK